ncbi:MAG: Smr/MutS family protein [Chitinophagaceae bacterium]
MKYQLGDEIVVLHSNEEGKIIEIINDEMVLVEVRGVKFPVYIDQIDFPYFKRFSEQKNVVEKKNPKKYIDQLSKEKNLIVDIKNTDGVWLSLLPKFNLDEFNDEVVELFKIYLINKTQQSYKFIYKQNFFGETNFELQNELLAFNDFYLHDISFSSLNDNLSFAIEFSLLNADKKKVEYFETALKLKPKQVFKKIEELKEKNQPTIFYRLFEKYPDKLKEEKFASDNLSNKNLKIYDASKLRENLPQPRSVTDLHIEKITDDWQSMTSFEMLSLQLKEFERWYHLSVANHQPNLIVIHGVGTGKLRDEIHDILKTKREVKTFVNQYDPRFGYGATEIFFQY